MRLFKKALLGILSATTLSPFAAAALPPRLTITRLTKCDDAALSAFIPSHVPPLDTPFKNYIKQLSICERPPFPPSFSGRNRFVDDYYRFAYFYNQNLHSTVPETCRIRFQVRGQAGFEKLPETWRKHQREMTQVCSGRKSFKLGQTERGNQTGGEGDVPLSAASVAEIFAVGLLLVGITMIGVGVVIIGQRVIGWAMQFGGL